MRSPNDMRGKVALVTGAASGLGRATALRLGRAGVDLCVVDVNAAGLDETADELRALKVKVLSRAADLASHENCSGVVEAAVEAFDRLDALCNVAGIMAICHTAKMSPDDFERIIDVNLKAPFYLIQAAIPHLLKTHGAVVNVTSQASFIGQAYMAAYCAAKAGLTHMTKALAMEYVNQPVRINAVAPGGMVTGMTRSMEIPADVDPELMKRFFALRGVVEVEDVAELVVFLASDAARGYHGACICLDNGVTSG